MEDGVGEGILLGSDKSGEALALKTEFPPFYAWGVTRDQCQQGIWLRNAFVCSCPWGVTYFFQRSMDSKLCNFRFCWTRIGETFEGAGGKGVDVSLIIWRLLLSIYKIRPSHMEFSHFTENRKIYVDLGVNSWICDSNESMLNLWNQVIS